MNFYFTYFSFSFNDTVSLIKIPTFVIILLWVKYISSEKAFCRYHVEKPQSIKDFEVRKRYTPTLSYNNTRTNTLYALHN